MKTFYMTQTGEISQHKIRAGKIIGHGIVHLDQNVIVYTTTKRTINISYPEIKVGAHTKRQVISLQKDELITRIDIVTLR